MVYKGFGIPAPHLSNPSAQLTKSYQRLFVGKSKKRGKREKRKKRMRKRKKERKKERKRKERKRKEGRKKERKNLMLINFSVIVQVKL